ncbi:ATP-binding protein [Veillonella atypica]|jgi:ABC transporter, ATP-binding protein|uniref:AAA family ATPase n=1 Tax=Veillonella atypica TaxID=39777 RepID=UPI001D05DA17|nr:AAA family ATPase [Veillonella atypica]MCB6769596.1 ATP-binding protein [Veillonella atypica]MDU1260386.1 AAA family ATPase [Veillonella sp.]
MQLKINNIGKIKSATFEFNGITVIAGNNNTGKSTVGKVLFALFSKFNNINKSIEQYKNEAIIARVFKALSLYQSDEKSILSLLDSPYVLDMFKREKRKTCYTPEDIEEWLNLFSQSDKLKLTLKDIKEIFDSSSEEINRLATNRIKAEIVTKYFNDIFDNQINNMTNIDPALVNLNIKDNDIKVEFIENECSFVEDNIKLINKAIYVDDPYIIDSPLDTYHRNLKGRNEINNCLNKLLHSKENNEIIEQILAKDKYKEIEEKINLVINGQLIPNKDGNYTLENKEYPNGINVSNLSTGLKSFLIIKKLITDNLIINRDILILDEPEIHLHPEWQIVYAELLVLLQKYFDLTILLTTHSPFFLRAIEVFSRKYYLNDKCKYYLALENEHLQVTFEEVKDTSLIYDKMAKAFFLLNDIEDSLVDNNED